MKGGAGGASETAEEADQKTRELRLLLSTLVRYECVFQGDTIVREGDMTADEFYVIVRGRVAVLAARATGFGDGDSDEENSDDQLTGDDAEALQAVCSAGTGGTGGSHLESVTEANNEGKAAARTLSAVLRAPRSPRLNRSATDRLVDEPPGGAGEDQGVEVAVLERGTYFGEMALVAAMPRSATIIAKDPCVLLCLKRADLDSVFQHVPGLEKSLELHAKHRMLAKFRATQMPLLKNVHSDNDVMDLARGCAIREMSKGDYLWKDGDEANEFCIVIYGTVELTSKRQFRVDKGNGDTTEAARITLDPGEYFGESALVLNTNRTESARCVGNCVILSMAKVAFFEYFRRFPALMSEFEIKCQDPTDLHLKQIISNMEGRRSFMKFLTKEMAAESLMFYMAVEEFRTQAEQGVKNAGGGGVAGVADGAGSDGNSVHGSGPGAALRCTGDLALRNAIAEARRGGGGVGSGRVGSSDDGGGSGGTGGGSGEGEGEGESEGAGVDEKAAAAAIGFPAASVESVFEIATGIYHKYIDKNAPRQVNIASRNISKISSALESRAVTPSLFDSAQAEVFRVMTMDNFRRFKESMFFKGMGARRSFYGSKSISQGRRDSISNMPTAEQMKALKGIS